MAYLGGGGGYPGVNLNLTQSSSLNQSSLLNQSALAAAKEDEEAEGADLGGGEGQGAKHYQSAGFNTQQTFQHQHQHQQQYRQWEVPPQLQAAFAGAPPAGPYTHTTKFESTLTRPLFLSSTTGIKPARVHLSRDLFFKIRANTCVCDENRRLCPPVPAHAAWATSLQQRSVDGLLRAQVAALRTRLRTAVRRTEATRYHSSRSVVAGARGGVGGAGAGVGAGGGRGGAAGFGAPRPSSATAAGAGL